MPRPKSSDPRQAITLRLPTSVILAYQTGGPDWRVRMEAILCGRAEAIARIMDTHPPGQRTQAAATRSPTQLTPKRKQLTPSRRVRGYANDGSPIYS